jgi:putative hydrolase of the HAD superfamily
MIFYKKLKPIRAMTFDLDDTLYENTSVILKANARLQQFMHNKFPKTTTLPDNYWRELQKKLLIDSPILKNDMSQLRYETLQLGFANLGYTQQKYHNAAQQCFDYFYVQRSHFSVRDEVHLVLKALSNKLPLVAITNGNVDLKSIDIEQYFCASFKASVDLLMKPNKAMFTAAQDYLALPANQILHVGDNLHKDVYGAINAGYQAAWYADDREMALNKEHTYTLPHVQLYSLENLLDLVL